jgi:hypothetical protein
MHCAYYEKMSYVKCFYEDINNNGDNSDVQNTSLMRERNIIIGWWKLKNN